MCHSFFIYSSVNGHLGCFHDLAIVNSAAMNIGVHVSFFFFEFYSRFILVILLGIHCALYIYGFRYFHQFWKICSHRLFKYYLSSALSICSFWNSNKMYIGLSYYLLSLLISFIFIISLLLCAAFWVTSKLYSITQPGYQRLIDLKSSQRHLSHKKGKFMFTQKPVPGCSWQLLGKIWYWLDVFQWENGESAVCTYHGILLSNKEEQTIGTHNNLDEFPGNYVEWQKPIPQSYILYDYIYITFLKWQHYKNEEQIGVFQRLETGEGGRREMGVVIKGQDEGFLWCWNCLLSWLWWWIHKPVRVIKLHRT